MHRHAARAYTGVMTAQPDPSDEPDLIASAARDIAAPPDLVWRALTNPALVKRWMFGTELVADFTPGSRIEWHGEYEGRAYEDHGEVLEVEPGRRLVVTHYSPLSGRPESPETAHTLTWVLEQHGSGTILLLTQSGAHSEEEQRHDAENWAAALEALAEVVEVP